MLLRKKERIYKKSKTKKLNGSYSIEAGLLMPFIIFIIVSIIYLTFFLYDECLMQQTAYLAGLRTSYSQGSEEDYVQEALEYGKKRQEELLAAEGVDIRASAERNKIILRCEGRVATPFGGRFFKNAWSFKVEQRAERSRPVQLIRNCRKIESMLEG